MLCESCLILAGLAAVRVAAHKSLGAGWMKLTWWKAPAGSFFSRRSRPSRPPISGLPAIPFCSVRGAMRSTRLHATGENVNQMVIHRAFSSLGSACGDSRLLLTSLRIFKEAKGCPLRDAPRCAQLLFPSSARRRFCAGLLLAADGAESRENTGSCQVCVQGSLGFEALGGGARDLQREVWKNGAGVRCRS